MATGRRHRTAFQRGLPKAEIHFLDTGHFALEEEGAEIDSLILDFLQRKVTG
jgi:pimeloyl-ACP methyl ester carboxylesterase